MDRLPRLPWTVAPLGDSALLLTFGDRIDPRINDLVHAVAAWIRVQAIAGVRDLVPAYATLAVHFNPVQWDAEAMSARLARFVSEPEASHSISRRIVTVPVCYGGDHGPDLSEIAARAGLAPEAFVARHASAEYAVMFLGFAPGFAYLSGLDPSLATPRRTSPRTVVPRGSVGIGGEQTGVYPSDTPGGWHLIGRTGLRLFDAHHSPPCLLQPGDRVRFEPVPDFVEAPAIEAPSASHARIGFIVEQPGLLTSVQDLGRPGYQHLGVTPGGAIDDVSHRVANWIVGNDEQAATLELTIVGPTLVVRRPLAIALYGAAFHATVDDRPLPLNRRVDVREGARVRIGAAASGARGYLAVEGGFDVPAVLDSRGTALRDRFGGFFGRALRKGDELPIGDVPNRSRANRSAELQLPMPGGPVRVMPGPHWLSLTDQARDLFLGRAFDVTPRSDRMGLRLGGPALALHQPIECLSAGVVAGTIQLPPDGQPIVLLADRQTTGGYPRIGEIISADLHRLAQLRPGDAVRFSLCTMADARAALLAHHEWLDRTHRLLSG